MFGDLCILTGNAHPTLARDICSYLRIPLTPADVFQFSNENIFVRLKQSVRSQDVYVIQPFSSPVNQNIMELLIILDTCKRASAGRITAVIPYYAYGRTDKKDQPRVPITARLIADLIAVAGAHRVVTLDLHAQQIQGFFSIPMDELTALPLLAQHVKQKNLDLSNLVILSPDIGAAKRARDFAEELGIASQFAIINKRRDPQTGKVAALKIIGYVAGHDVLILDEEINTGSSVIAAARAARRSHVKDMYVACTHAVFSGDFARNLTRFPYKDIAVTDTLPLPPEKRLRGLSVVSIAPFLGDVIKCIHDGRSLGKMIGDKNA